MNNSAERHLSKARDYLAKGDQYYRRAKPEIEAAHADGASLREMSRYLDRSKDWVHAVLRWDGEGTLWGSDTGRRQTDQAKQVLREAPLEQVEQMIAELPPERQQDVAAAAGHAYMKARQDYRETERDLSPAKRKEREAAGEAMTRPVVSAVSSFTIISRLEVALEELRELNASGDVPAQMIDPLDRLIQALVDENRVTRAMAGRDIDLDEVRT